MFGDKAIEAGLKKLGHVQRRNSEDISRWTLRLELAGRRSRAPPGGQAGDIISTHVHLKAWEVCSAPHAITHKHTHTHAGLWICTYWTCNEWLTAETQMKQRSSKPGFLKSNQREPFQIPPIPVHEQSTAPQLLSNGLGSAIASVQPCEQIPPSQFA